MVSIYMFSRMVVMMMMLACWALQAVPAVTGRSTDEEVVTCSRDLSRMYVCTVIWLVQEMRIGYKKSRKPTTRSGHRPTSLGLGLCGSRGAWRRRVRWSRMRSSAKFVPCFPPTRAVTSSPNGTCSSVRTATSAPTRWSSGRWRSVSCRASRWTVSASNESQARRSVSRT